MKFVKEVIACDVSPVAMFDVFLLKWQWTVVVVVCDFYFLTRTFG